VINVIVFFAALIAVAGAVYLDHRNAQARLQTGDDAAGGWAFRHGGKPRDDGFVAIVDDVEVTATPALLDPGEHRWVIVVRAATRTGHDLPRLHRGTWPDARLPLAVDADDEPRACCTKGRTTVPHAIVSDGGRVVAWLDAATATVDDVDVVAHEVVEMITERPLVVRAPPIVPPDGGPFR
jgi:hypothetical protein